jgi:hypothetical protein
MYINAITPIITKTKRMAIKINMWLQNPPGQSGGNAE